MLALAGPCQSADGSYRSENQILKDSVSCASRCRRRPCSRRETQKYTCLFQRYREEQHSPPSAATNKLTRLEVLMCGDRNVSLVSYHNAWTQSQFLVDIPRFLCLEEARGQTGRPIKTPRTALEENSHLACSRLTSLSNVMDSFVQATEDDAETRRKMFTCADDVLAREGAPHLERPFLPSLPPCFACSWCCRWSHSTRVKDQGESVCWPRVGSCVVGTERTPLPRRTAGSQTTESSQMVRRIPRERFALI